MADRPTNWPGSIAFALSFIAAFFYIIGAGWNHCLEVDYSAHNSTSPFYIYEKMYFGCFEYCYKYRDSYYKCEYYGPMICDQLTEHAIHLCPKAKAAAAFIIIAIVFTVIGGVGTAMDPAKLNLGKIPALLSIVSHLIGAVSCLLTFAIMASLLKDWQKEANDNGESSPQQAPSLALFIAGWVLQLVVIGLSVFILFNINKYYTFNN